jgi:adenosylmethionine-8-amino-7-oxononanoate aminotransferase
VLARVALLSTAMAEHMAALCDHPSLDKPRQVGVIAAIDIRARDAGYLSDLAPRLRAFFLERGLLLRPLGNTIYVMPPYCIDDGQLTHMFASIAQAAETLG